MFGRKATTHVGGGDVVALISLRGTIAEANGGGGLPGSSSKNINFQDVQPLIDQAFMLDGVKAIVLVINSPGGSPCQTNLISSYIRDKTEETKIPVYALVEDIAASGGFWLACALMKSMLTLTPWSDQLVSFIRVWG